MKRTSPRTGLAALCMLLLAPPLFAATPAADVPAADLGCSAVSAASTIPQIVAEMEATLASLMAQQRVPGVSFAIVKDGQVVHAKGYGVTVLNGATKVTEHTVFEAGSTTKAFTAALVAMLVPSSSTSPLSSSPIRGSHANSASTT